MTPSHGFRAWDGSGMEWCMPLSVQYPLLSGWELGWPFRALQTQPFMSGFHSQTTTMTLPSSSSSTTSSSPCAHIVSPRLCLEFFVRGEMRTRVCSCVRGTCNSERRAFERWRCLLQFGRSVAQHRPGCDRGQITRFPHSSACCQSSWGTGSMESKPAFLTTNTPEEQMTQIKCSCAYVERIFSRLRNCIMCLLASFQSGHLEKYLEFQVIFSCTKVGLVGFGVEACKEAGKLVIPQFWQRTTCWIYAAPNTFYISGENLRRRWRLNDVLLRCAEPCAATFMGEAFLCPLSFPYERLK